MFMRCTAGGAAPKVRGVLLASTRRLLALCALGALGALGAGCNGFLISGVSVEAVGGTTMVSGETDEMLARSGRAWNVGFTVNLETEWVRTSTMGTGIGWTKVSLPAKGAIPAREIATSVAHLWLGTIIDVPHTDSIRPRVDLGFSTGGEQNIIREAYLAFGSSFHGDHGWSLHASVGPQVLSAYAADVGEHDGFGWQARVRIVKLFFPSCDKAVDVFDGEAHKLDAGCNE